MSASLNFFIENKFVTKQSRTLTIENSKSQISDGELDDGTFWGSAKKPQILSDNLHLP